MMGLMAMGALILCALCFLPVLYGNGLPTRRAAITLLCASIAIMLVSLWLYRLLGSPALAWGE